MRGQGPGDRLSPEAGVALTCVVPELAVPEHREDDQQVAQDVHHGGEDEHREQSGRHPGRPRVPGRLPAARSGPARAQGPPARLAAVAEGSVLGHLGPPCAALPPPRRPLRRPPAVQCAAERSARPGRRPVGRELKEIIKPRQGAESNVGTGGGLGVQALPKGVGPLGVCSGAAATELLALPPRDQHVSRPAQTSVSERKDPPFSPSPRPPEAVLKGGTPRCADWIRCWWSRPAVVRRAKPSSKENAIPRLWEHSPERSRVESYTLGSCRRKVKLCCSLSTCCLSWEPLVMSLCCPLYKGKTVLG